MDIREEKIALRIRTLNIKDITNHLISQGYVQVSKKRSYRHWVDCVHGGSDIAYYTSDVKRSILSKNKRDLIRAFALVEKDGVTDVRAVDIYSAIELARTHCVF